MKKLLMAAVLLGLSTTLMANCGNNNGNGNGCSNNGGSTGPQGPQGSEGPQGLQGVKGLQGIQGVQGPDHIDPRMNEAKFGVDTAIRLYDSKRFQWQVYNIYSPSTHDKEDVFGDGRNLQFGARVVFKLGSSYEERRLDEQENKIKALEAALLASRR